MGMVAMTHPGVAGTAYADSAAFTTVYQPLGWTLVGGGGVPTLPLVLEYQGAWVNSQQYNPGDFVTYGGNTWVALVLHSGVTPGTDATKWGGIGAAPVPPGTYTPSPGVAPSTDGKGAPAVMGPAPTGTAATDRTNLLAAIGDTPVGGRLLLPSSDTFFVTDQALPVNKHITIDGDSIASTLGEGPSGTLPVAPYLYGTVIKQVTAATDILQLTGIGKTVNLHKLGLLFPASLASTGHGVNATPSDPTKFGLFVSRWDQVFVHGHDGNHYAFFLVNYIANTFTHCHSYLGGGWWREARGQFAGNSLWQNPFVCLFNAGTAGCYDAKNDAGSNLNGDTFVQPVGVIGGAAATASTQPLWDDTKGAALPFKHVTIGAQLQDLGGTNPLRKSTGTQFLSPGQCDNLDGTSTVIGVGALGNLTGQANQTAYGFNALAAAASGSQQNTAIGTSALAATTTALQNTAIGYHALAANTTGGQRTAVGSEALAANTTGGQSTAIGFQALKALSTGTQNTAIGYQALLALTSGNQNTAVGLQALVSATTATGNTAIGFQALATGTTGNSNTVIGTSAGNSLVTGALNTLIGVSAGTNSTDVNFATVLGGNAGAVANALALGYGTHAYGTGSVAIGMDNASTSASTSTANEIALGTALHTTNVIGNAKIGGSAKNLGFYGTTPIARQTGVAVTAAGIHAACVALGLFTA